MYYPESYYDSTTYSNNITIDTHILYPNLIASKSNGPEGYYYITNLEYGGRLMSDSKGNVGVFTPHFYDNQLWKLKPYEKNGKIQSIVIRVGVHC